MYKAIVIGVSKGGLSALLSIIPQLPAEFSVPVVVVQHIPEDRSSLLAEILNRNSIVDVVEAQEKKTLLASTVYIAPPGYHLLIDEDATFALDEGDYVCYSRPSVDVLFESAANVYKDELIAIVLTGANNDGSSGMNAVKKMGGYTIVQDFKTAEAPEMIVAAMEKTDIDKVLSLDQMADFLRELVK